MEPATQAAATVCLLTPLARGGLAVVRVFGPAWRGPAERVFRADRGADLPGSHERLKLGRTIDPANGETIDQAVLRVLPGDLGVELTLHGGIRVVQRVVQACIRLGARRLDVGRVGDRAELWCQAFLLARAGGVARPALWADVELALPAARTQAAANWLVGQWGNGLGNLIDSLIEQGRSGKSVAALLEGLLLEYPAWRRALGGVRVAIVGPVNAGKSTLLNALAGAEAAIVSDRPGTTRDYTARWVNLAGLAVELIDTAGLRPDQGPLEGMASELAAPVIRQADLRLVLLDGSSRPTGEEVAAIAGVAQIAPSLVVVNKSDLPTGWDAAAAAGQLGHASGTCLRVSAKACSGLEALADAIRARLGLPGLDPTAAGLFTERQADLVRSARQSPSSLGQTQVLEGMLMGQ